MVTTDNPLLRTPLFDLIVAQKARLTPFSGWEMPVQFQGLKQEHHAVRNSVGMFDISHMGKFILTGKDVIKSLEFLVPSNLSKLKSGQAQYTVLLNEQAGIIDDIIVYYQGINKGQEQVTVIVNAATTDKDKAWILEHISHGDITLQDLSRNRVLIALQGREALANLQPLVKEDVSKLKAFTHLSTEVLQQSAFIARTGYTGEDGFEIMIEAEAGRQLWQLLLAEGVTPCGLGARDTLRLEAAMCLYGQDIDESTTPLEAGLGWLVHLDKGEFIGKEVLVKQKMQGVERKLVGLVMEGKYIARHGYRVIFADQQVGEVTSGTFAPTLAQAIGLAYVPKKLSKVGQQLAVEVRGKLCPCRVVKKPFYRSPHRG